jgi:uncharacterized protein
MLAVSGQRNLALDTVRGVAVMGILLANIPAFAFPMAAYFSPLAAGTPSPADMAAWLINYAFVEGRLRGLFSFLFGASMLLITDRGAGSGRSLAQVHGPRLAVLFAFGIAHLYLVWRGDILAHYALVAIPALAFVRASTRKLLIAGVVFALLSLLISAGGYFALLDSASRDTPGAIATWNGFAESFGRPPQASLDAEIAAMRGSWLDQINYRVKHAADPLTSVIVIGPQTLAAMLFGMAAYRSGLLTGDWQRGRLWRWAGGGLLLSLPLYLAVGWYVMARGFDQRDVFFGTLVAGDVLRWPGIVGYAALIVALAQPGGWLTGRIAAVGRAAFSNYLGTSILVTFIFYGWGLGLFGALTRAQLYLVPPVIWLVMLAWSKPWLERFRYGPLEWLWRSLARGAPQPMRLA